MSKLSGFGRSFNSVISTDKVAGPDPRQSAANAEEGLQLQVFPYAFSV